MKSVFAVIICVLVALVRGGDLVPSLFHSEVIGGDKTWLIEFYSPMCGSCQEFAPIWDKLEKNLKSTVSMGKINIDQK